jgi:hypothetical protein
LQNGQSALISADQWDGSGAVFAGTSDAAGQTPTVTLTGPNTLTSVVDIGTTAAAGFGAINLMPGGALTTAGLTISAATLWVSERPGSSVTFNGTSRIVNASTLTATGYPGVSSYNVNGTMNIDGSSTVNMDYVAVTGIGTFHLTGEDALLRAGSVSAGETVVLDGGMLSLTNGISFLGTITDSAPGSSRIGPIASVSVYNALDAVRETFNETTGVLNLFNIQDQVVANLKFAGSGDLYATPTSGLATNFISITSHATGSLPHSFTQ